MNETVLPAKHDLFCSQYVSTYVRFMVSKFQNIVSFIVSKFPQMGRFEVLKNTNLHIVA